MKSRKPFHDELNEIDEIFETSVQSNREENANQFLFGLIRVWIPNDQVVGQSNSCVQQMPERSGGTENGLR